MKNLMVSPKSDLMNLFATKDYVAKVSSVDVANYLGVEHKNLLRIIDGILSPDSGWSEEFTELNIEPSNYKDSTGRKLRCFNLTRDGFMATVKSCQTKRANEVMEQYILAFDAMYDYLLRLKSAKDSFPLLCSSVKNCFTDAEFDENPHLYSNEANLMYMVVLGHNASFLRKQMQLDKEAPIKEYLNAEQNEKLDYCQRTDCTLLDMGIKDYSKRKAILTQLYTKKYGFNFDLLN